MIYFILFCGTTEKRKCAMAMVYCIHALDVPHLCGYFCWWALLPALWLAVLVVAVAGAVVVACALISEP